MREYLVEINVMDGEQIASSKFYIEAENFDEAVEKVENDFDVSLK